MKRSVLLAIAAVAMVAASCNCPKDKKADDCCAQECQKPDWGKYAAMEAAAQPNTLTEAEAADGWKLLFDGKTTEGWQSARPANMGKFPEGGWGISEDGLLYVFAGDGSESTNGGDIITDRQYRNFILKVDFKLTPGANSGIKYFVDPFMNQGAGSSIGCEFQVLDDNLHPDAKLGVNGNRTMGSLYDLIPAPKGEWETYTIDGWQRAMIIV